MITERIAIVTLDGESLNCENNLYQQNSFVNLSSHWAVVKIIFLIKCRKGSKHLILKDMTALLMILLGFFCFWLLFKLVNVLEKI